MSFVANFAKVFVYGTLKNGQPNHYWLTDTNNGAAHLIGNGTTQTKFPLIIASQYNVPFLLCAPGTGHYINGEIYSVDERMMQHLDELEDYPQLYDRTKIDITDRKGYISFAHSFFSNSMFLKKIYSITAPFTTVGFTC